MPQISSIEPQKKRKRFNVFTDGKFAFGCDPQIIVEKKLSIGKNLTNREIDEIISKETISKLTDKALHFLSFRPRSEKEVSDFLTKKIADLENIKFNQAKESPLIKRIIAKFKKYHYLDDLEFTRWFVKSRVKNRPKGASVLTLELRKKGISSDAITQVINQLPNQTELAIKAVSKKLNTWSRLAPVDFKRKIYQYLAPRGFNYETIKEAIAILVKKR